MKIAGKNFRRLVIYVFLVLQNIYAQPEPGDVFREYRWSNIHGDAGGALRVGGKNGMVYPERGSAFNYINAAVVIENNIDLEQAIMDKLAVNYRRFGPDAPSSAE